MENNEKNIKNFTTKAFDKMVEDFGEIKKVLVFDEGNCFAVDPKRYTKNQITKIYDIHWGDDGDSSTGLCVTYYFEDEEENTLDYSVYY